MKLMENDAVAIIDAVPLNLRVEKGELPFSNVVE
jgi:hypothetical protein